MALLLEYFGADFAGWQRQVDRDTVQGALERALGLVTGHDVTVYAAGRTDAGVHALGQVVHFDTDASIPAEKYRAALEAFLPPTVSVRASAEVPATFHARKDAVAKTYQYRIAVSPYARATLCKTHLVTKYALSPSLMNRAAERLVGTHDFASFYTQGSSATTTVRTVTEAKINVLRGDTNADGKIADGEMVFTVTANGFLYNMIRIITAQLLLFGQGRKSPEEMDAMLAACNRRVAKEVVAPQGLYLVEVKYPSPVFKPDHLSLF